MARRRFFVSSIHNHQAELTGDDAHHLVRVLRVEAGQHYEISDGGSVYLATVDEAHKNRVVFSVGERVPLKPPPVRLHLLFALPECGRSKLRSAGKVVSCRPALFARVTR